MRELERSGLDPASLLIEITEGAMMSDATASLNRFRQLKEIGVRLAIDDFGTGYSSLSWLRTFPVDIVKLPKPFIDALPRGSKELAFVEAIAKLGSTLNLDLIAEGIEHEVQATLLRQVQVTMGQGYHYGHPLDVVKASELLAGRQSPAAAGRAQA
jgi:EAL domain-containing protein (putative c-di-GMP-specific phosphodiesterase class I)